MREYYSPCDPPRIKQHPDSVLTTNILYIFNYVRQPASIPRHVRILTTTQANHEDVAWGCCCCVTDAAMY